jgi:lipopolysaccharide/colanic/teichoic acid biosynthesis glycosyltransferase
VEIFCSTSLWQVTCRSEGDLEMLREQDLFYIRNWSHWLDFYILLQTAVNHAGRLLDLLHVGADWAEFIADN